MKNYFRLFLIAMLVLAVLPGCSINKRYAKDHRWVKVKSTQPELPVAVNEAANTPAPLPAAEADITVHTPVVSAEEQVVHPYKVANKRQQKPAADKKQPQNDPEKTAVQKENKISYNPWEGIHSEKDRGPEHTQVVGIIINILAFVLAIAAIILIVVGVFTVFTAFGIIGIVFGVAAIILGIIGFSIAMKGLGITGFVLGLLIIIAVILLFILL